MAGFEVAAGGGDFGGEALWQELMRSGVTPEGKRSDTDIVFPKAPPK